MNTSYNDINQVATGARIRQIRKAKGLKVTDISTYMGFESPQAVYKWQRGDSLPDLGNMMRLLELFQITDIREVVVMTGSADDALPFQFPPQSEHLIHILSSFESEEDPRIHSRTDAFCALRNNSFLIVYLWRMPH